MAPSITVVGSVNLDLVARVERLPRPGETVTDASFERIPGGKGANQAVAAARLGADVRLVCSVGRDVFAHEALPREERLEVAAQHVEGPTGVAIILVDEGGENQIVVAPGANALLGSVELRPSDAVLCQLEIPDEPILAPGSRRAASFASTLRPRGRSRSTPTSPSSTATSWRFSAGGTD